MHQTVGQLTIVGEQQQPLGGRIQTTNVEESLTSADLFTDDVAHTRTTHVIVHGRLHTTRLVQDEVLHVLIDDDAGTINADYRRVRVHPHALSRHDLAIDLDAAFVDKLFRHTTRRHARLREHLLQAHALTCLAVSALARATTVVVHVLVARRAGVGYVDVLRVDVGGLHLRTAVATAAIALGVSGAVCTVGVILTVLVCRCAFSASGFSHLTYILFKRWRMFCLLERQRQATLFSPPWAQNGRWKQVNKENYRESLAPCRLATLARFSQNASLTTSCAASISRRRQSAP